MTESFAQLFEQSLANQRIRPGMILTGLVNLLLVFSPASRRPAEL